MNEFVEPSIAEFRFVVSDAIAEQTEAPALKSPEWYSYQSDLINGLREVKQRTLTRMTAGVKPGLISVSSVLRAAGRGRTQFYEQHGAFQKRINLADAAAKRLWECIQRKPQPRSRSDLEAEIRSLKARLRATERRFASQKLSEIALLFQKTQG